jgi:hypothetical protein
MLIVIDTNNRPPYWSLENADEWRIVFTLFETKEKAMTYCSKKPLYHNVKDKEILALFPLLTKENFIDCDKFKREDEIIFINSNLENGCWHGTPTYFSKYVSGSKMKYLQVFNGAVYNESVDVRTVAPCDFNFLPITNY